MKSKTSISRTLLQPFSARFGPGAAMRRLLAVAPVLLCLGDFVILDSHGQGTLRYTATDLSDVVPGQDLWRYSYFISGFNFQANQGFSIYFNHLSYGNLQNARPSLDPGWNMVAVQPDVLLQVPGYLDGLARVNGPAYTGPFQVDFIWLGLGVPGAQPFEIYDANFQTLFSGVSEVPEPGSGWLVVVGSLLLLGFRAKRGRKRP